LKSIILSTVMVLAVFAALFFFKPSVQVAPVDSDASPMLAFEKEISPIKQPDASVSIQASDLELVSWWTNNRDRVQYDFQRKYFSLP